jgi:ribonuclease P/MRP protein subunit RPP1
MDLNLCVEKDGSRDSKELILSKIKTAFKLGYKTIALSVHLKPDQIERVPPPPEFAVASNAKMKLKVYTRLTVQVEDSSQTHKLSQSQAFKKYDIIAIEPLSDKMLNILCGGNFDCEIITFSMAERLPINLKKVNFTLPRTRGICCEINYSEALFNQTSRQNVISSSQLLVDKNKGRNILISSGAQTCIALRGAHDVANLGLLFGLKENQAKEAVFKMGIKVTRHSDMRKNVNSNAVTISSSLEPEDKWLLKELADIDEPQTQEAKTPTDGDGPSAKKRKT